MNLDEKINEAVKVLEKGGVVIYPTETVYGLGADIFNKKAVEKIFKMKGREGIKAISIALREEDIEDFAVVDEKSLEFINKLPGPLTLVLRKQKKVPEWITKTDYVGIRVPDEENVQKIIKNFGPITSTSANLSGEKAPSRVEDINEKIKEKVDLIIDDGPTPYKKPSTVVKINDNIEILRKGALELQF